MKIVDGKVVDDSVELSKPEDSKPESGTESDTVEASSAASIVGIKPVPVPEPVEIIPIPDHKLSRIKEALKYCGMDSQQQGKAIESITNILNG